ncbi:MAG: hypothetical protein COA33_002155 [Fluviicola sp.]|nr:hypothetical protein [Fluviicola sp.]
MIVEASIPGLFRMLLIIVGVILLLRFLGQFMTAKRNMEEEREMNASKREFEDAKQKAKQNIGKTKIVKQSSKKNDIEDVDFEEID